MSDKAIGTIVGIIIGIALTFWLFNNPSGIGDGLNKGGANVKDKIIQATSNNP
ncbi:hypothetical protein GZH47_31535 (plasmid) [Paenibacillus rhizovicinus]|uniref:Uncharacterized protein n=1 Tax=Paenibacillus rhizovicinus TaxID=2704463 RepID=A0A6C0PC94_9BACL|nr:hypothetical protein [Paenibacillus rhizovicinus]QHW35433.1 hypothetical protein GZH47_31535 [Paenibacillus rhizovicinus]